METRTKYRATPKLANPKIKAVSLRIPIEVHGAIQAIAIEQKRSVNGQIGHILEEWLAKTNQTKGER